MSLAEPHVLLAMADNGTVYCVGRWDGYDAALERWLIADEARRDHRARLLVNKEQPTVDVQYLMVRSAADPRWTHAPGAQLYAIVPGTSKKGYKDDTAAARRVGVLRGFVGNGGGWIYRKDDERPAGQGWWSTMRSVVPNLAFHHEDGRWYAMTVVR